MVSRAQRTPFGEWWWTVDRLTIGAIGALMLIGVVLSLAASPPVAGRLGLDPFFFVNRHILYLFPATAIMIVSSTLLIAGYMHGYKAFKNIWVVSALSITLILVAEPLIGYLVFGQMPTRGAIWGFIFGALGFIAVFVL